MNVSFICPGTDPTCRACCAEPFDASAALTERERERERKREGESEREREGGGEREIEREGEPAQSPWSSKTAKVACVSEPGLRNK